MRNKGLGIAIAFGLIIFAFMWAQTNGFASQPVASTDVTVRQAAPTVNDDIDRGFLPGYQWVDQAGQDIYGLVSGGDGTADWDLLNGAGGGAGGHIIQDEGIDLTARTNLNFIGTGITCADDGGSDATDCTIGSALHEYGNLFQDDTAPDAQVLTTAGVFEVLTEFTGEGESSAGVTLDGGNNNITLDNAGTYVIGYSISFLGSASKEYHVALFSDGVELFPSEIHRTLSASGAVGVGASATVFVAVSGGEVIDLRASPQSNGDSITIAHGSIVVDEIQDFGSDDLPALADDSVWVGSATSVATASAVPDCNGANVNRIQYDTATNTWSCETDPIDVTADITGIVPIGNGGTGQVSATEDGLLMGNTSAFIVTVVPDCQDSGGNHLNFNNTTDAWDCGTSVRAIDISDDTNLTASDGAVLTGDDISTTLGTSVDVTSEITGIVPVANGGTGTSSITATEVMIGSGAAAVTTVTTGTAGFVLTSNGAAAPTWQAAAGGGDTVIPHGRMALSGTDFLTLPGVHPSDGVATEALVADSIHYYPIYVATDITVDRMLIQVTTGAGGSTTRMGIFESDIDWQVGALVFDAGTTSTATTGVKTIDHADEILVAGRYLMALLSDGGPVLRTIYGTVAGHGIEVTIDTTPLIYTLRLAGQGSQHSGGYSDPGGDWTATVSGSSGFEFNVFLDVVTP